MEMHNNILDSWVDDLLESVDAALVALAAIPDGLSLDGGHTVSMSREEERSRPLSLACDDEMMDSCKAR